MINFINEERKTWYRRMNSRIPGDNMKCDEKQEEEQGRAVVLKANRRMRVPSESSSWRGHWRISGMGIRTSKCSIVGHRKACRQPLQMSGKRVSLKSYKSKRDKRRNISSFKIKRAIGRCLRKGRKGATAERNRQHMVSSHGKRVR